MGPLLYPTARKQREVHSGLVQELWTWSQKIWVPFTLFFMGCESWDKSLSFKKLYPEEGLHQALPGAWVSCPDCGPSLGAAIKYAGDFFFFLVEIQVTLWASLVGVW